MKCDNTWKALSPCLTRRSHPLAACHPLVCLGSPWSSRVALVWLCVLRAPDAESASGPALCQDSGTYKKAS